MNTCHAIFWLTFSFFTPISIFPLHQTLYIFLFCGLALIAYTLILTMVSRLYKMRLVDRVYPNHDKIEDYIGLLKNKHDQRKHHDPHAAERMTAEDLKKAIGNVMSLYEDSTQTILFTSFVFLVCVSLRREGV